MKLAALIPARISSKRLPKKNIKKLCGKPLVNWTIDIALSVNAFSNVCVSTESEEVASIVRDQYPDSDVDILVRPEKLATDSADLKDVCKHYLERHPDIDYLALMMPTYPFRKTRTINERILPAIYSGQIDRVLSVRPESYSTLDYWMKCGEEWYQRIFDGSPLWCSAGNAAYTMMKREYFFIEPHQWPTALGEKCLKVVTDDREAVDIDTPDDFKDAEKLAAGYGKIFYPLVRHENDTHVYVLPEGVCPDRFEYFLNSVSINGDLPVLILADPPPYFTFLRVHEVSYGKNYYTQEAMKMLASLPESGHSQDIPVHYIHSRHYRVIRKGTDYNGRGRGVVPSGQVIFMKDLEAWDGYKEPYCWEKA